MRVKVTFCKAKLKFKQKDEGIVLQSYSMSRDSLDLKVLTEKHVTAMNVASS